MSRQRNSGVEPLLVAGAHMRSQGHSAVMVDQAHDRSAINCGGDGLTEAHVAEPLLLARDLREAINPVVEDEHQEVVFEARACVVEFEMAGRLLRFGGNEIISAEAADKLRFSRLKANHLRILRWYHHENQFVEIRKALALAISFPVVGIALEHDPVTGNHLLQPEGAQARYALRRGAQRPGLPEHSGPGFLPADAEARSPDHQRRARLR